IREGNKTWLRSIVHCSGLSVAVVWGRRGPCVPVGALLLPSRRRRQGYVGTGPCLIAKCASRATRWRDGLEMVAVHLSEDEPRSHLVGATDRASKAGPGATQ